MAYKSLRGKLHKKAIIAVALVDESKEKNNAELEKEILNELSKDPSVIPWMKKVLKVKVFEESNSFSAESSAQG